MTFTGTIRLNLDRRGYAEKPSAYVGAIRNRLCTAESIRDLTVDQFTDAIQRGYTFTPAAMTGTTGDTWQGQQVICADIDNDSGEKDEQGNKIMLEQPLKPDEARAVMKRHGINPCFMYYSFSNSEAWPKYRVVLVLEQPLTDRDEAAQLTARFAGIFNAARPGCADTAIRDSARLFYGGRADCVFYASRQATSADTLRALPEATTAPEKPVKGGEAQQASSSQQSAQRRAQGGDIRDEIEVFDLAAYIRGTESAREVRRGSKLYFNPCPICGHNDCFQVTDHLWHCWSDGHSGTNAGTIIDYLQRRHGLTLAEAMRMFDNDITGGRATPYKPAARQAPEDQRIHEAQEAQQMQQTQPEENQQPAKLGDGISTYISQLMQGEIQTFTAASRIRTGFDVLDKRGGGGLYPGLYAVGAISSLGKTTFIHQMADQIAAAGGHVLFFSLEQSRLELATKSLARTMAQADYNNALTSLKIRQGVTSRPLAAAIQTYTQAVGDRMNVIEGDFTCTVATISEYVNRYIERHKARPVVIVDYLQIMQAQQQGAQRRDDIDANVTELKRLTRAKNVPVIVISSVNRQNYLMPVDFESFKESGGIEYTADVVWGLQLACMDDPLFNQDKKTLEKRARIKEAKSTDPRDIQLVCLKNRYGGVDWNVDYKYYPRYDLFEEVTPDGFAPAPDADIPDTFK